MSVYSHSGTSSNPLWLDEKYIYGSSRLGMQQPGIQLDGKSNSSSDTLFERKVGDKRYELTNHLGNVLAVINNKKLVELDGAGNLSYFKPEVLSYNDYYPLWNALAWKAREH